MIEPNMATTLAFIATNAKIHFSLLDEILRECIDLTFNSISTDGCQSTNDMVILIANNKADFEINKNDFINYNYFKSALFNCLENLAKKVVEDAEGATKFIEINILGAVNLKQAQNIGKKIANSLLFKTAMYGEDINWGRIAAAIGSYELDDIDSNKIDISISDILLMKNGVVCDFDEIKANELLKQKNISFKINLNLGKYCAKVLTSDITYEYIKINAFYKKQK